MVSKAMKKKNVIVVSVCVVASFIIYQLYFFLNISSEDNMSRVIIPLFDHSIADLVHLRSEEDKFINEQGILRGVYFLQMPRYRPDKNNEFKCLESAQTIPYERVNDDYCDCEDGTDEPSTNACPNGIFNCDTQSYKKSDKVNAVPSGRINDGICDCCDGSDEWLHKSDKLVSQSSKRNIRIYVNNCPNVCTS